MGFTFGSKHVLLVGLVTLLLTYAAFHDKLPHGTTVSVQGRKGLPDPSSLGDDVVATQDVPDETEEVAVVKDAEPSSEENAEFSQDNSEEVQEERVVRKMEETPPAGDAGSEVIIPEPEYEPNPFLRQIRLNNADAASKEKAIQRCIAADDCGTP